MKKQDLLGTFTLYYFTGGLYALYWIYTRGVLLHSLNSSYKQYLPKLFIISLLCLGATLLLSPEGGPKK